MRGSAVGMALAAIAVAAGCGGDRTVTSLPPDQRYRGTITVLESPEHGPQLCGYVLDSHPPECDGADVAGWSWHDAPGAESANGTTWGRFEVTGTWDGDAFTLTEPPGPPGRAESSAEDVDFASPCPEPDGGWRVIDPEKTTQETMEAVSRAAQHRQDFAGLWLDQSIGSGLNRPDELIINVRVTGDVEDAERDLREEWGGALCVSKAERTYDELRAIQDEIYDPDEVVTIGVQQSTGIVDVTVLVDDGLQATYDERYGEGTVAVTALLRPVD